MGKNKVYPTAGYDAHGIKFYFDYETKGAEKKHFTLRFAGNPMLTLEYLYKLRGGTDFQKTYESVKAQHSQTEETKLLVKCAEDVKELMDAFALMSDNEKSPFVIYVNDFSEYR